MSWCPECGAEYVDGVAICADCKVPVSENKTTDSLEYLRAQWRLIAEYPEDEMGILAKGLLESNDIPCRLENLTSHPYPIPVSQTLARVRIWVETVNEEAARKLIEATDNYLICSECEAVVAKEDERCPSCDAVLDE